MTSEAVEVKVEEGAEEGEGQTTKEDIRLEDMRRKRRKRHREERMRGKSKLTLSMRKILTLKRTEGREAGEGGRGLDSRIGRK